MEIAGLLFTAVTEGLVGPASLPSRINQLTCSLAGRRCTLLTMLTSSTVTFFLISFYYPKITVFHKFLVFFANLPTTTANTLIVLFTGTDIEPQARTWVGSKNHPVGAPCVVNQLAEAM